MFADGLHRITSIGAKLSIVYNNQLQTLSLFALTSVDQLEVQSNAALLNFGGLTALTSVYDWILIANSPLLTSVSSLCSLVSVGGSVSVSEVVSLCCEQVMNVFSTSRMSIGGGNALPLNCKETNTRGCMSGSVAVDACTVNGVCASASPSCVHGVCVDERACVCDMLYSGAVCDVVPACACSFVNVNQKLEAVGFRTAFQL